jgi:hypothetical protein
VVSGGQGLPERGDAATQAGGRPVGDDHDRDPGMPVGEFFADDRQVAPQRGIVGGREDDTPSEGEGPGEGEPEPDDPDPDLDEQGADGAARSPHVSRIRSMTRSVA